MKNKEVIINKIKSEGYTLGIYDNILDKLNKQNLKKVLDNIKYVSDTKVFINRKPYIVEISEVDSEIDFSIITLVEYESRYGKWY
jgi:hypothetical protein|nr:MAG TPA_asm: hypothetical protein [Caudoviricetes sp.]